MEILNSKNKMQTFSDADQYAMGEFLLGQLEKLDQRRYGPMYNPTYKRDINFRSDVNMYDTASSYVKYFFRANNGSGGKIADGVAIQNATPEQDFVYRKYTQPLYLIERAVSYNFFELKTSVLLNRPIDQLKYEALMISHDMEMEKIVYIGNEDKGTTGLLNNPDAIANEQNLAVNWLGTTPDPDGIVKDINDMFTAAWQRTGYNVLPKRMLMSPILYSRLVEMKVSQAGNCSVLNYVKENSIVKNELGVMPEILSLKWLDPAIPNAIPNRIIVYDKDERYLRIPYVPMQRLFPNEIINNSFKATYYAKYGGMELVYPETLNYFKVKTA